MDHGKLSSSQSMSLWATSRGSRGTGPRTPSGGRAGVTSAHKHIGHGATPMPAHSRQRAVPTSRGTPAPPGLVSTVPLPPQREHGSTPAPSPGWGSASGGASRQSAEPHSQSPKPQLCQPSLRTAQRAESAWPAGLARAGAGMGLRGATPAREGWRVTEKCKAWPDGGRRHRGAGLRPPPPPSGRARGTICTAAARQGTPSSQRPGRPRPTSDRPTVPHTPRPLPARPAHTVRRTRAVFVPSPRSAPPLHSSRPIRRDGGP